MALGVGHFAAGIFIILAYREPMKNILSVRSGIMVAARFLDVALCSGFVLFEEVTEVMAGIVNYGVIQVALHGFSTRDSTRRTM
jgi:energy-converting hydrogenase Eha subunit C